MENTEISKAMKKSAPAPDRLCELARGIGRIPLSGRVTPRFSTELDPTVVTVVRDVGGRVFVGGVGDDVADAGVLEERVGRSLHGRLAGGVEQPRGGPLSLPHDGALGGRPADVAAAALPPTAAAAAAALLLRLQRFRVGITSGSSPVSESAPHAVPSGRVVGPHPPLAAVGRRLSINKDGNVTAFVNSCFMYCTFMACDEMVKISQNFSAPLQSARQSHLT